MGGCCIKLRKEKLETKDENPQINNTKSISNKEIRQVIPEVIQKKPSSSSENIQLEEKKQISFKKIEKNLLQEEGRENESLIDGNSKQDSFNTLEKMTSNINGPRKIIPPKRKGNNLLITASNILNQRTNPGDDKPASNNNRLQHLKSNSFSSITESEIDGHSNQGSNKSKTAEPDNVN